MKVSLYSSFRNAQQVEQFFLHTPQWMPDRVILAPTDWNRGEGDDFWRVVPVQRWESYPFGCSAS